MIKIRKRNGKTVEYDPSKIENAIVKAFWYAGGYDDDYVGSVCQTFIEDFEAEFKDLEDEIDIEDVQDRIEAFLMKSKCYDVAREFILFRQNKWEKRNFAAKQLAFIENYKKSDNNANATIDDNSNVNTTSIASINNEIHKTDNIVTSRYMVMKKLNELFPEFDAKEYARDLTVRHYCYKHDESSFAGAISPYCASISLYPFLTDGIKCLGGLSGAPKNLDSFCGMFCNLVFAVASQFAGAVATSEFLMYFDYFAKKKWGEYYYKNLSNVGSAYPYYFDETASNPEGKSIEYEICQKFQQVVYTINQPSGARGNQAVFWNVSYFSKEFFEGMFGEFIFPDGTKPNWASLSAIQKLFMTWFNKERLKTIITFPVETVALIYKDDTFTDEDTFDYICNEYAEGHSMFTYISDTPDSLSSCCRLKNKLQTKEFNFTNGNMGLQTGSKSVITLNLNRIIQDWSNEVVFTKTPMYDTENPRSFLSFIGNILNRVYKYHEAYNELLKDMYNSNLMPVYSNGFINLNKQYLTIGLNGLNEAAEYLGIDCNDNDEYQTFCEKVFSYIKEQNEAHRTKELRFNTEMVPAESLALKNYNWDKTDGYWVPEDRNLYASYIYIPADDGLNIYDKITLHGKRYIGEYLDGGSAAHINLSEHPTKEQVRKILTFAAEEGCQYLTFNVPNCQCEDCGHIAKTPFDVCPHCGSKNVSLYDRIIGYLTKIKNWSSGRQKEQKTRKYIKA